MASSKLAIYKNVALILKNAPPSATSDDTLLVNRMNDCYDATIAWCLEQGYWNFAARTVQIDADESITQAFGYTYAFDKPDDWVRTTSISASESLWPPLGPNEFVDETSFWSANCNPLYVSYVSNGASYGLDLSLWTETFARAVEYELAFRIAPHVTSMGEDALAALEKRKYRALKDARSKDAMNQASKIPPPGRLGQARGGNMRRGYFGTTVG
jgi:hypothetical protein